MVLAHGAVARSLDPEREPEDLDEADGGGVVERIALVVRREVLVVQAQRAAAPDDAGPAMIKAHPDLARDHPLRRRGVRPQVARQRAEPQTVVHQPRQLVGDHPVEPERVARQGQPFERPMRGVQDRGRRCLVDLAALDPDQPVLDVIDPADAVGRAQLVDAIDQGDRQQPLAVDGDRLQPVALVERVHELGAAHGVGRIDHVEDRLVGIKSREIYEAPAATILHEAHRALEGLTLTKDTLRFNQLVANELAQLTYDGLWFSALHRDLRGYVASSQRVVSGEVRVRLDHGSAVVTGRRSPLSLYDKNLATYDQGDAFDHAAAVGFIGIFGLPLRVEAARHGAVGGRYGAAWTWTDPLLDELPTTVSDDEEPVPAG